MNLDTFIEAYTVTALVMFPILVFIAILLVRDLGKYSKLSEKINNILKNLSEDLSDKGYKKNSNESVLQHISRYINKNNYLIIKLKTLSGVRLIIHRLDGHFFIASVL